jgi:hypothetical protein
MMTMKPVCALLVLSAMVLGIGACAHPASPPADVRVSSHPQTITLALDARDYDELAADLAQSILADSALGLGPSRVLALGPVDTDACKYDFDIRRFQEKLQTILLRSHKVSVSFALDAIKTSDVAAARYNVMLLQWKQDSAVDPQDLKTFGKLARVDYLLFGRLSDQTAEKGPRTEVTYTFNWKLGACESGLLAWADERERVKTR